MAGLPKVFFSSDVGAPVLDGSAGSVVRLMDACLITGYNIRPCRGAATVGGVCTMSLDNGHGFKYPDVIEIKGAMPLEANGQFRVKESGSDFIKFDLGVQFASVAGADVRKSAAGWVKVLSKTNRGVYTQKDEMAREAFWDISDGNLDSGWNTGLYQRAKITAAHDVDGNGNLISPFSSQWIAKSRAVISNSGTGIIVGGDRPWTLIADDRFCYLLVDQRGTSSSLLGNLLVDGFGFDVHCFGNINVIRNDFSTLSPVLSGNIEAPSQSTSINKCGPFGVGARIYIKHSPSAAIVTSGGVLVGLALAADSGLGLAAENYNDKYYLCEPILRASGSVVGDLPGCMTVLGGTYGPNDWSGFFFNDGLMFHRISVAQTANAVLPREAYIGAVAFRIDGEW